MWVNETKTLWLDRNKDTWQLPVVGIDGVYCGNVVAQIVDPKQCLVQYFVIFSPTHDKKFVIPSEIVTKIDVVLHCICREDCLHKLPEYEQTLSVELERKIRIVLDNAL